MKNFFYNVGYFLKEAKTLIRLNFLSNVFSIFSTGLVFFILAMVVSGWWVSNQVAEVIQGQAEINVYFAESPDSVVTLELLENVKGMESVREARMVDKAEAYDRMEKILGKEARVLEFLEDNPFNPFIEVKINLEEMNHVIERLKLLAGVENVRDNQEVLERIQSIAGVLRVLGLLVVAAVSISTLVIISHIIRLGVYNNSEQINTLRLLGAPEIFIAIPFLLQGLILTLGGGIFAASLTAFVLKYVYSQIVGPLPFIPLPPREYLISSMVILSISFSASMGIIGSIFGLSSAKRN